MADISKFKLPGNDTVYNLKDDSAAHVAGTAASGNLIQFTSTGAIADSNLVAANMISADDGMLTGNFPVPESTSNKVTTIDSSSTDIQYPSAKATYTFVNSKSLPSDAEAGDAMIYDGTAWTKQSGYGYFGKTTLLDLNNIEWIFNEEMGIYGIEFEGSLTLKENQEYFVIWGNTSYTVTCSSLFGQVFYLGEIDPEEEDPSFVNYPFFIGVQGPGIFIYTNISTVTSCKIETLQVTRIDDQYIYPSATIAGTALVYNGREWSTQKGYGYTLNGTLYQFDDIPWALGDGFYMFIMPVILDDFDSSETYNVLWGDTLYEDLSVHQILDFRGIGASSIKFIEYPFFIINDKEDGIFYIASNSNTITSCTVTGTISGKIDSNYLSVPAGKITTGILGGLVKANTTSTATNDSQIRNIAVSDSAPSSSDGNIGDIWMIVEA